LEGKRDNGPSPPARRRRGKSMGNEPLRPV